MTDADVVLGRLSPDEFLGGELRLDCEAARAAIEMEIAKPLNLDANRAAAGIVAIAVSSMANAVRSVTAERGLDPRDFTLLAYGGGGPPHAVAVARELAIRNVIIPRAPAHFSAFGMLLADIRRDFVLTHFRRWADVPMGELETMYRQIEGQGEAELRRTGVKLEGIVFERAADMRYVGQEHAVSVSIPPRLEGEDAAANVKSAFDQAHQLRYSHCAPEEPAELVSLRVSVIGRVAKPPLPPIPQGSPEPPAPARRDSRKVIFDDYDKPLVSGVFDRLALLAGNMIEGPAVVEEPASSTLLGPGDTATVDQFGHLVIRLKEP